MVFLRFGAAAGAKAAARDLMLALRFYTRLPLPPLAREAGATEAADFGRALRLAPLAGAAVGGLGAAMLAFAAALGLPVPLGAILALATTIVIGGALHEDGLADVADGFGGGRNRAAKLDIMRDSRIGAYGTLAIVLSLAWRGAALAEIEAHSGTAAAAGALVAAAAVSRGFGLLPLLLLAPARPDGLGAAAAGGASGTAGAFLRGGIVLAGLCGLTLLPASGFGPARALGACALAAAASFALTRLSARQIGGQTGDVAGAAQQAAEAALLTGLLIGTRLG